MIYETNALNLAELIKWPNLSLLTIFFLWHCWLVVWIKLHQITSLGIIRGVTIQIKATEQYFTVALLMMLYKEIVWHLSLNISYYQGKGFWSVLLVAIFSCTRWRYSLRFSSLWMSVTIQMKAQYWTILSCGTVYIMLYSRPYQGKFRQATWPKK